MRIEPGVSVRKIVCEDERARKDDYLNISRELEFFVVESLSKSDNAEDCENSASPVPEERLNVCPEHAARVPVLLPSAKVWKAKQHCGKLR